MDEIIIVSTYDSSKQPSFFFRAGGSEKRPLLVGLHTWSYNRFNMEITMLPYAEKYNFNLLLPNFRGANLKTNPDYIYACGSEPAKRDIFDAVNYAVENENADSENVFLLGASGGGHMALLMAAYRPEMFKAVGAFVPISDLEKWSEQNPYYRDHVFACCECNSSEMKKRSPISYIDEIAKANVKIFHGKYDETVPFTQSVTLYEKIIQKYPASKTYLDIFDGGYEMNMEQAFFWIMSQYKKNEAFNVTG